MRQRTFVATLLLTGSLTFSFQGRAETISNNTLYIRLSESNKKLSYSGSGVDDGMTSIRDSILFNVKGGEYCNVYVNWLNPLKYKIQWTDSTFQEKSAKASEEFVSTIMGKFGAPTPEAIKAIEVALIDFQSTFNRISHQKSAISEIGPNEFQTPELNLLWYLLGKESAPSSDESKILAGQLRSKLLILDAHISSDIKSQIRSRIYEAFSVKTPKDASEYLKSQNTYLDELAIVDQKDKEEVAFIRRVLNDNSAAFSGRELKPYFKATLNDFLNRFEKKVSEDNGLIKEFSIKLSLIENSLSTENASFAPESGSYFISHEIVIPKLKVTRTTLVIQELAYNPKDGTTTVAKDTYKAILYFKERDWFKTSVSGGFAYSSVSIRAFGVAASENGKFRITEENTDKAVPLTAIFMNTNLKLSPYFSPLIQLGLSPARYPFFLIGGGFLIPAYSNFGVSFGGVWTWTQVTSKLTVGQEISSTTELESDLKHSFNMHPKGWYLGIQYHLGEPDFD